MPVPQIVTRNYIAIVNDTAAEQRALESLASSPPRLKDYLRRLMATLLRRRRAAA